MSARQRFYREPRTCDVSLNDNDCESPPAWAEGEEPVSLRTTCYRCGQAACKACSLLVKRRRVCRDCISGNGMPGDPTLESTYAT